MSRTWEVEELIGYFAWFGMVPAVYFESLKLAFLCLLSLGLIVARRIRRGELGTTLETKR